MTWMLYRWVWQLLSPVHIGTTPAGSLNRTRLYVPARALWGAFTAELARRKSANFPDYQNFGQKLSQHCRFSYLFPAQLVKGRWLAWLPRYEEGQGLLWRREDITDARDDVPERVFRSLLLTTRAGTAIDPWSDSAAEGTLREYEVINPWSYWREGKKLQPVAFAGYVILADGADPGVLDIEELFIGGDTRYGLGQVQKVECSQASELFGKPVDLTGKDPQVQTNQLLAYGLPGHNRNLFGALEQLIIWDYGSLRSGSLTWVPGSRGSRVKDNSLRWRIRVDGFWEYI